MLDRHGQWAGVLGGGPGDGFGHGAVPDAGLGRRGMAHEKAAILNLRRGHDLEVILDAEIPDLDLAQADDGQRGRLHAADADDALDAAGEQRPGRRAGQRQVEDLVGLLPGDGGLVERAQLAVGFELVEGLAQRLGVLGGEQGALDGAAIAQVLQDFLADQLALAVAVGGEDHLVAPLERGRDRLQLGGLVALGCGLRGVEPVRLQQHARPSFPRGLDLMGLGQPQQVSLGRQDLPEPVAERRAEITGLAGLLGDDQDRHGPQPGLNPLRVPTVGWKISRTGCSADSAKTPGDFGSTPDSRRNYALPFLRLAEAIAAASCAPIRRAGNDTRMPAVALP